MSPAVSPGSSLVMVFAKAPDPGRVKTRLARELGDREAARIYRRIGRAVVDEVRQGSFRTVVYFDPPDAEEVVARWLGRERLEFHPQPEGDLGHRLSAAFEWGFARAGRVAAIGTDIPEIDHAVVEAAFQALSGPSPADAVFGPALDGGYYLVALRRPAPRLFHDIPWSTDAVLDRSLERAAEAGLKVLQLPPLADVDHADDVPERFQ